MKALVFDLNIPRYLMTKAWFRLFPRRYWGKVSCLGLKEIPTPSMLNDEWAVIRTRACGICGSDLSAIIAKGSFSMEPYASFPSVMGHEAVGEVFELGGGVTGFRKGDRVAVDSILPCVTRGIETPCPACQAGRYSLCRNFRKGLLSPGPVNGFNASVGGGFGEYFIAHRSQLFHLPDGMTAEQAVLIDPVASALEPAVRNLPRDGETVLVYGCGIIGLGLIGALRAVGFKGKIIAVARYSFQGERAASAGADVIISRDIFKSFGKTTGSEMIKPHIGRPVFEGGVDIVFDCVGSSTTFDNSMRFLRPRGRLVLVGAAGSLRGIDASPIWFREINITGSSMYSNIEFEGKIQRTYQAALDLINSGRIKTGGLVTHRFKITEYEKAINTALDKRRNKSIKVIFDF